MQALRLENPPYDFDAAFRIATSGGAQMVLVLSSPFFLPHQVRILELANASRLPSMFIVKHWAQAGGLMTYGADFLVMYRRAADYVATRITARDERLQIVPKKSLTQTEAVPGRLRAAEISTSVAFSASLTATPPKPRNPPSLPASAAFWATF